MKKFITMIIAAASIFAAVSCNRTFDEKEVPSDGTIYVTRTYEAGLDEATKTTIDAAGKVTWEQGDVIRYYSQKNGEVKEYTIPEGAAHADLTLDVASTASFLIGVYGGTALTDNLGSSVTIQGAIPAEQTGIFGDHHVAITKTYDVTQQSLTFHNLVSYLKFTLTRTDVAKVVFKANDATTLCGDGIRVSFDGEAIDAVEFTETGSSSITVNNGGAGTFYIATLPCSMNAGFKVDFYDANGDLIGSALTGNKAQLAHGKILNLGVLDSRIKTYNMEYVDLGLSAKWAKCNIGANVAEGGGDLYAWGEIATKTRYDWDNYKWSNNGQEFTFLKYSGGDSLMAEDDVATCLFGDKWSIPTMEEWDELKKNCTWTLTTLNGIAGYRVVSDINGNEIFIPSNDCGHILDQSRYVFSYWRSDDLNRGNVEGLHEFIDDDDSNMGASETASLAYGPSLGRPVRAIYERNSRPVQSRVDLSATGTANSYIVTEAGYYKFKANVKGNSTTDLDGTPYRAEVLWESFGTDVVPSVGDLVSNVTFKDGYILFEASELKGNAVIAVENRDEDILWSWHIWLTDQPSDQVYNNGAGTMMDRNLGATSATPGDVHALGLLYQWGRKDPFLGGNAISSTTMASSTGTWPAAISIADITGDNSLSFALSNPMTFIFNNESLPFDWYSTDATISNNELWSEDKSIYDPCPPGYSVPKGGADGVWARAAGTSTTTTVPLFETKISEEHGIDFSSSSVDSYALGGSSVIWYPSTGSRVYLTGDLFSVGLGGSYWSCSHVESQSNLFNFRENGYYAPADVSYRAIGRSVRCYKEGSSTFVPVTAISLNKTSTTIENGKTDQLTATITPASANVKTVTWSTSNSAVATVAQDGLVSAKGAGTCTITATSYNGLKATCEITVTTPVTAISLNKTSATIENGKTLQLTATITPTNATNKTVTWSTSSSTVATVSASGLVTAKAVGTCTITATSNNGLKATCAVTVVNSFWAYILAHYDTNKDGTMNSTEIAAVTNLDLSAQSFNSLSGIEKLTALKYLNVSGLPITSLDISKNTKLVWVYANKCTSLATITVGSIKTFPSILVNRSTKIVHDGSSSWTLSCSTPYVLISTSTTTAIAINLTETTGAYTTSGIPSKDQAQLMINKYSTYKDMLAKAGYSAVGTTYYLTGSFSGRDRDSTGEWDVNKYYTYKLTGTFSTTIGYYLPPSTKGYIKSKLIKITTFN